MYNVRCLTLKYVGTILGSFLTFFSFSQVNITGPECVLPGVQYEYVINIPQTTSSSPANGVMKICLNGGTIIKNSSTCLSDSVLTSVIVYWDSLTSNGSINLSGNVGSATFNVIKTKILQSGTLAVNCISQEIGYDSLPAAINCSSAIGGSCNSTYSYQWQSSSNGLQWMDIIGASAQNLLFGNTLQQTTFYRRRVIETSSGTIGYSEIAVVYVNAPKQ